MEPTEPTVEGRGGGSGKWGLRAMALVVLCAGALLARALLPIDYCTPSYVVTPCATIRTTADCTEYLTTKPAGTLCDDGSMCTINDQCDGLGSCVGTVVTCQPLDQCHVAGTCDPATGCSNPLKANGTACNDGNACTQTDTCQAGTCAGSNPVTCTALDQCHDVGTCDPATGVCSNPPKVAGTPCNDANLCTYGDSCNGVGLCTGTPVSCLPRGPCDQVLCNGTSWCALAAVARGTACSAAATCGQVCDGISPYCQPTE